MLSNNHKNWLQVYPNRLNKANATRLKATKNLIMRQTKERWTFTLKNCPKNIWWNKQGQEAAQNQTTTTIQDQVQSVSQTLRRKRKQVKLSSLRALNKKDKNKLLPNRWTWSKALLIIRHHLLKKTNNKSLKLRSLPSRMKK